MFALGCRIVPGKHLHIYSGGANFVERRYGEVRILGILGSSHIRSSPRFVQPANTSGTYYGSPAVKQMPTASRFIADSSPAGNKTRGECDAKNPEASSYGRNVLSRVLRGARMHCMVQRSYKSPPLGEGRGCVCNLTSNTGIRGQCFTHLLPCFKDMRGRGAVH